MSYFYKKWLCAVYITLRVTTNPANAEKLQSIQAKMIMVNKLHEFFTCYLVLEQGLKNYKVQ